MDALLPPLVIVGCLAVVMAFFGRLASLVKRRGAAGAGITAAMAAYDEAFRVTAHDAHYEIQAQAERQIPLPAPDDPQVAGGSLPYRGRPAPPRRRRSVLRRWARRVRG
ncbi:hypothetical protein OIE71_23085 [Streptomyces sp. NBC_01725]|uniref:hypothetical protein n=1 Tax=Streptomyces sp. NBC_01725 TaxID=2975923 RepID=UPI002E289EEB|nr:hypothetical protein [Streptomyces sp. NBC_01725]